MSRFPLYFRRIFYIENLPVGNHYIFHKIQQKKCKNDTLKNAIFTMFSMLFLPYFQYYFLPYFQYYFYHIFNEHFTSKKCPFSKKHILTFSKSSE